MVKIVKCEHVLKSDTIVKCRACGWVGEFGMTNGIRIGDEGLNRCPECDTYENLDYVRD